MYKKYIKVLFILPFLFLHIACGYEPLMTEKYQKYTIKNFNISGDKKLGQLLSNKFSKLEKGEHTISFNSVWVLCLDIIGNPLSSLVRAQSRKVLYAADNENPRLVLTEIS